MPVSDQYGRAFEFCVADAIISRLEESCYGKVRLTANAKKMQLSGRESFMGLSSAHKAQYENSARRITDWLIDHKLQNFGVATNVEFDRVPDLAGVSGDVTDIRLTLSFPDGLFTTTNISLKHRHEALKHPRLTRVPEWIGVTNPVVNDKYSEDYKSVWASFFKKGKELNPTAERFRELKAIDTSFIEENLYKPLYKLVADFLNNNIKEPPQVQMMFDFMVGNVDYVKFVDQDGKIEVRDFSNIPKPSSVKIKCAPGGYIYFTFDNGLKLSGRLHTATEWLKESIKFDIQPCNLDALLPAIYI